jgi:hypothetical protein
MKKQINRAAEKSKKSKGGRPPTIKPSKLADHGEREDLLKTCNDLASIFLVRAVLDKRLRYLKEHDYNESEITIAENDLAHFEEYFFTALSGLKKVLQKLEECTDSRSWFSTICRKSDEVLLSPNEQLSDLIFRIDDNYPWLKFNHSLYRPSETWLLGMASWYLALGFLAKDEERLGVICFTEPCALLRFLPQTEAICGPCNIYDLRVNFANISCYATGREDCFFARAIDSLSQAPKINRSFSEFIKTFFANIEATERISSPIKRADIVIAKMAGLKGPDRIRDYRNGESMAGMNEAWKKARKAHTAINRLLGKTARRRKGHRVSR